MKSYREQAESIARQYSAAPGLADKIEATLAWVTNTLNGALAIEEKALNEVIAENKLLREALRAIADAPVTCTWGEWAEKCRLAEVALRRPDPTAETLAEPDRREDDCPNCEKPCPFDCESQSKSADLHDIAVKEAARDRNGGTSTGDWSPLSREDLDRCVDLAFIRGFKRGVAVNDNAHSVIDALASTTQPVVQSDDYVKGFEDGHKCCSDIVEKFSARAKKLEEEKASVISQYNEGIMKLAAENAQLKQLRHGTECDLANCTKCSPLGPCAAHDGGTFDYQAAYADLRHRLLSLAEEFDPGETTRQGVQDE